MTTSPPDYHHNKKSGQIPKTNQSSYGPLLMLLFLFANQKIQNIPFTETKKNLSLVHQPNVLVLVLRSMCLFFVPFVIKKVSRSSILSPCPHPHIHIRIRITFSTSHLIYEEHTAKNFPIINYTYANTAIFHFVLLFPLFKFIFLHNQSLEHTIHFQINFLGYGFHSDSSSYCP